MTECYFDVIPKGYHWVWCAYTTENYPDGTVLERGEIEYLMRKYKDKALNDEIIFCRDLVKNGEDK